MLSHQVYNNNDTYAVHVSVTYRYFNALTINITLIKALKHFYIHVNKFEHLSVFRIAATM